jgi:uncharacterized repeat protein (TIGR03847 family)
VPREVFQYDEPERFVVGTVGEPGHRTFFLQARAGSRLTSVALEKEQVSILAQRLDALLDEVVRRTGGDAGPRGVPALAPAELADTGPLEQPIEEEFRVGTMTLAWDADDGRAVIEALAVGPADEADPNEADPDDAAEAAAARETDGDDVDDADIDDAHDERSVLVVRLGGAAARAFVVRALAVVGAGRPPCPLCGQPLDPEGHICPRQNGYRRRV